MCTMAFQRTFLCNNGEKQWPQRVGVAESLAQCPRPPTPGRDCSGGEQPAVWFLGGCCTHHSIRIPNPVRREGVPPCTDTPSFT